MPLLATRLMIYCIKQLNSVQDAFQMYALEVNVGLIREKNTEYRPISYAIFLLTFIHLFALLVTQQDVVGDGRLRPRCCHPGELDQTTLSDV